MKFPKLFDIASIIINHEHFEHVFVATLLIVILTALLYLLIRFQAGE